jgi:hypothetical protein
MRGGCLLNKFDTIGNVQTNAWIIPCSTPSKMLTTNGNDIFIDIDVIHMLNTRMLQYLYNGDTTE